MSANGNGDEEIPGREIAYRLFAAEYDDASLSYAESDEERAPNYVIAPTGARLNRVFAVGTLTEVTSVNDEMLRARVVDPTGAFVVYAGQYQPDELAALEQLEPPAFVAVTGKARTYQPDDSDRVYTSIRPESIATVDADTRDRWVVSAAEQTLERIGTYARVAEHDASDEALTEALHEAGVERGLASGVPLARDHYATTADYLAALRDCAVEAVEVVAGDREQVSGLTLDPSTTSPEIEASFDGLATLADVDVETVEAIDEPASELDDEAESEPVAAAASGSAAGTATAASGSAGNDGAAESASAIGSADETDDEADADDLGDFDVGGAESDEASVDADAGDSDADADEVGADVGEFDADADETVDDAAETDADIDADAESDDLGDFDGGMYEMDEEEREQIEEEFGTEFTTGADVDDPGEAEIDSPSPDDEPAADTDDASANAAESDAGTGGDEVETDVGEADAEADTRASATDDELGTPPESSLDRESESDDEPDESEVPEEPEEADAASDSDDEDATVEDEAVADDDAPGDGDEDATAEDDTASEDLGDVDLEAYVVETMEELDDGSGADRTELVETVAADTGASEDEVEDAIQDALMGGQCYEPDDETLKAI